MSEIDANKIEALRGLMQQDAWGDVPFSGYVLRSGVRPALPALLDAAERVATLELERDEAKMQIVRLCGDIDGALHHEEADEIPPSPDEIVRRALNSRERGDDAEEARDEALSLASRAREDALREAIDRSKLEYELDRLRAENVELSHREKVRSEAINRALTCQRELAEEARSVADLANKLFDQREEYLSGLNARNAELSAENARMRSALEPFASRAGRYDPDDNDDGEPDWSTAAPSIRIGDLRRARAALSPSRADGEGR